jgi:processive 1,2-diacylglycerol beta-glucosyltransferase
VPTLAPDSLNLTAKALASATPYPALPAAPATPVRGKVLITYVSAGNGHRTAAQAIEASLKARYPGVEVAPLLDLADVSKVGKSFANLLYPLVELGVFPWVYNTADKMPASASKLGWVRREIAQTLSPRFNAKVRELSPDLVISTHQLGAELIAGSKASGRLADGIRNMQVVTDAFGHKVYVLPGVDATFVPNREVADQLAGKGMPVDKLFVSGIPINPAYAVKPERAAVRAALGFGQESRVLLVQGNLIENVAQYEALLKSLAEAFPHGAQGRDLEIAVTCGRNSALLKELEGLAAEYRGKVRLRPFGMLDATGMRNLMAASDLSVTKPGGLTTAESAAMDLPMILFNVMGGGQEGHNAAYFAREGAAVDARTFEQTIAKTIEVLRDPGRVAAMRANISRVGQPDSAEAVANTVAAALAGR